MPSGPKVQVRGTREHQAKILSLHYGTKELPDGLSILTPCFMTQIFTSHSWSFSEELIFIRGVHLYSRNRLDHKVRVMVRSKGSQEPLNDQTLAPPKVFETH